MNVEGSDSNGETNGDEGDISRDFQRNTNSIDTRSPEELRESAPVDTVQRPVDSIGQDDKRIDNQSHEKLLLEQTQLAQESLWVGAVPSPDAMQAFQRVDPSFPERIMRMSEDSVRTKNEAIRFSSRLESFTVAATGLSFALLPWIVCVILAVKGISVGAGIAGLAGFMASGAQLISAIRGEKDKDR